MCAYKPQFAHYAAYEAEDQLERTIDYIHRTYPHVPVILDSKRGDVGNTAERYAIEAFERYKADAVTVNPYLGGDSLEPFLRHEDKGVIILCRTSNPGARDVQDLQVGAAAGSRKVYHVIAELAAQKWNSRGNCMLVVGATYPRELAEIREIVGDMPLLVPGVGAQGGDVVQAVQNGRTAIRHWPRHQLVPRHPLRFRRRGLRQRGARRHHFTARSDQRRASLAARCYAHFADLHF